MVGFLITLFGVKLPSKRIIAKLDIKSESVVKGIQFEGLRKVGNPKELISKYCEDGADEIILNDVVASLYERANFLELIQFIVEELRVPLTVIGGIKTIEQAKRIFDIGADKIGINTFGFKNPKIYEEIAERYGSQAVIFSIEAKKFNVNNSWECMADSGRTRTHIEVSERIKEFKSSHAGELLITSVDNDGMLCGPDEDLISLVDVNSDFPILYGGGIRDASDVAKIFQAGIDACVIASSLHYSRTTINGIKKYLEASNFEIRSLSII